jgi:hypothetical protein
MIYLSIFIKIPLYLLFIAFIQLEGVYAVTDIVTNTITTWTPTLKFNSDIISVFTSATCIVKQGFYTSADYLCVVLRECWSNIPGGQGMEKAGICTPIGIGSYLTDGITTFSTITYIPTSTSSVLLPTSSIISNVTANNNNQCSGSLIMVGNYMGFLSGAVVNILSCEFLHDKLLNNLEIMRPSLYLPIFDAVCTSYASISTNYYSNNIANFLNCEGFSLSGSGIMVSLAVGVGTIISLYMFYINPFDTLTVYMWRTVGVITGLYTNILTAPIAIPS